MSLNLHTTTAMIDENGELRGLEKLESLRSQMVQVVIVSQREAQYDDSDLTPQQWQRGVSVLLASDFADDPGEDIYSREDGKPYDTSQD